jgi:manganese/zinc/iron transport system permease protein
VLVRWLHRRELTRKVRRQHLLRAAFERIEGEDVGPDLDAALRSRVVPVTDLMAARSWSARQLRREVRRACDDGLAAGLPGDRFYLTPAGYVDAARVVRNHRLWETYLVTHADVAPSHVDRDADAIEHVLGPDLVRRLESLVAAAGADARPVVPPSPHPIGPARAAPRDRR